MAAPLDSANYTVHIRRSLSIVNLRGQLKRIHGKRTNRASDIKNGAICQSLDMIYFLNRQLNREQIVQQ